MDGRDEFRCFHFEGASFRRGPRSSFERTIIASLFQWLEERRLILAGERPGDGARLASLGIARSRPPRWHDVNANTANSRPDRGAIADLSARRAIARRDQAWAHRARNEAAVVAPAGRAARHLAQHRRACLRGAVHRRLRRGAPGLMRRGCGDAAGRRGVAARRSTWAPSQLRQ